MASVSLVGHPCLGMNKIIVDCVKDIGWFSK